jgi:putative ABC transport system ATP-binding protein
VAIARALVSKAPIMLADEPTGNLDSKSGAEIMSILKTLNESGNTIILITHDSSIASQAKRLIRIRDGQIIEDQEVV